MHFLFITKEAAMFQIRLLIVCCLLGRAWNRPFVLVLFARAVEQRRSSLQLLLIIFTHLFICAARKKISKKEKIEIWRSVF